MTTLSMQRLPRMSGSKNIKAHRGIPMWVQRSLAGIALLLCSPLLLLVCIGLMLESPGGCFFKQIRVGKQGRRFAMYKFRSMYLPTDPRYRQPVAEDSDRDGVCKKYKRDPRITGIGRIIRKYSIDEIPQLFNIFKGDMALIGPRPALVSEVNEYSNVAYQRLNGMPGLSGLWQTSGRADTDFETQVQLDNYYLQTQSIVSDIKIIFATIPCVLLAKGAY